MRKVKFQKNYCEAKETNKSLNALATVKLDCSHKIMVSIDCGESSRV